jgi:hypothetical protein
MPPPCGLTPPWRTIEFQAGVRPSLDEIHRRQQQGPDAMHEPDELGHDGRHDDYRCRTRRMRQMLYALADALGLESARHHTKVWMKPWGVVIGRLYIYRGEPTAEDKRLWEKARRLAVAVEFPAAVTDERILPKRLRVA